MGVRRVRCEEGWGKSIPVGVRILVGVEVGSVYIPPPKTPGPRTTKVLS